MIFEWYCESWRKVKFDYLQGGCKRHMDFREKNRKRDSGFVREYIYMDKGGTERFLTGERKMDRGCGTENSRRFWWTCVFKRRKMCYYARKRVKEFKIYGGCGEKVTRSRMRG